MNHKANIYCWTANSYLHVATISLWCTTIAALDYNFWSCSYFDLLDKLHKPHVRCRSTQAIPKNVRERVRAKYILRLGPWFFFYVKSRHLPCHYVLHVLIPQCDSGLSTYWATRDSALWEMRCHSLMISHYKWSHVASSLVNLGLVSTHQTRHR